MSIKHLYEDERPTLLLDFANSKTLDPRITFERQSIGTYVDEAGIIKTAADNEARFDHDPETGESLGLLIEESRTNLAPESEDWGNTTYWHSNGNKGGLNQASTQDYFIATNNTTDTLSPDGANNAVKLAGDTSFTTSSYGRGRVHVVTKSITLSQNTEYTFSFFIKDPNSVFDSNQLLYIMYGSMFSNTNAYAVFDLQNNTVSYGGTYTSSTPGSIKSYPNGWKKLTATFTNTASGGGLRLFIMESDNFYGPNTFSTNGESFYAFGFQIEQGVFETSYIPTSGSTYQRVADEASITGSNLSNWYNDLAGAFVVKGKTFATSDRRMFINMDTTGVSGSTGSTIFIENNAVDLRFSQVGHGLKNKISITGGNGEWYGRDIRAAMAYDSTALNVRSNVQPTTYTPETTTTKVYPETLHIGSDSGTSSFFTGHISQIVYYNTTLSSTALEGLTT